MAIMRHAPPTSEEEGTSNDLDGQAAAKETGDGYYIVIFMDFLTDDKQEDSYAVACMFECMLFVMKELHP